MSTLLRQSSRAFARGRLSTLPRLLAPHTPARLLSFSRPALLSPAPSTSPAPSSFPPPNLPPPSLRRPPPSPPPPAPTTPRTRPRRLITSVDDLPKSFGRNQLLPVPDEIRKELEAVLAEFKAPVRYAFAYGSAVFRQAGYDPEDKPLLDFVFAVSHPSHWHAINMAQHPSHYSPLMRLLGSDAVAWMQEKGLGAGVWFNIEVEVNGRTIKYGCISIEALCRDMLDWETLYVSGRTQKPVKILHDDARVRLANQVNLASAMRTALLLLPESFTERSLYETIAGLSYRGDFRMAIGENPAKVRNIVAAQLDDFRRLYGGLLKSFWKSVFVIGEQPSEQGGKSERLMRQDMSKARRAALASKLPVGLRSKVQAHYERKWSLSEALAAAKEGAVQSEKASEVEALVLWERIVEDAEFTQIVSKSIGQIVARPTFNQSLKGILAAGPLKSLRYIGPKLRKKWWPKATTKVVAAPPSS